jgi:hypothetical protein
MPEETSRKTPLHIQQLLKPIKYLGVSKNMWQDSTWGKEKTVKKLHSQMYHTANKTHSIQEMRIVHSTITTQVAIYSPISIPMTITECNEIDKMIINLYQYRLKHMKHDYKHSIFLSM